MEPSICGPNHFCPSELLKLGLEARQIGTLGAVWTWQRCVLRWSQDEETEGILEELGKLGAVKSTHPNGMGESNLVSLGGVLAEAQELGLWPILLKL